MRRFLPVIVLGLAALSPSLAYADTLGDREEFNVESVYDAHGAESVDATLRAVGGTGYFYVDDRFWNALSPAGRQDYQLRLDTLTADFDAAIYPRSTGFLGSEAKPGVDGDPHVTVFLEDLVSGSGGYFQTLNNYSTDLAPDSNAREMVFISAASLTSGGRARDFLAHEFQHLISFNQKELLRNIQEDLWLNEARSEYNITTVGYSLPYSTSALQRRAQSFVRGPSDSLVEWPNTAADYAIASVFIHYLVDRVGPTILAETLRSTGQGIPSLDDWLASHGRPERFRDIFGSWMAAVTLDGRADASIGYTTEGLKTLRVDPTDTGTVRPGVEASWDLDIEDWQPMWLQMQVDPGSQPALVVSVDGRGSDDFSGSAIADYSGTIQVGSWRMVDDTMAIAVPTSLGGRSLSSVTFTITQGIATTFFRDRDVAARPVTLTAELGDGADAVPLLPITPFAPTVSATGLKDGDLIRKGTEKEVYVIWGKYRRYLMPGVLELYGFQNRPVVSVTPDVFDRYTTSNYIRQIDTEPVYSVWPDGTKHWLAITAAQWDASGRDWNAIFIVNEREAAFYQTGENITR